MSDIGEQSVKKLVLRVGCLEGLRIRANKNWFECENRLEELNKELRAKLSDGDKVLIELLLTEKTYLIHVENLIKFFEAQQEKQDNRIVSELLKSMRDICSLNTTFYKDLLETLNDKSATMDFPNVFLQFFPYFTCYINYVENFLQFSASTFHVKWKDENVPGDKLVLQHILSMPFQRIG
eukprot:UN25076